MGMFAQLQLLVRGAEDFEQTKKVFDTNPPESLAIDDGVLSAGGLSSVISIADATVDQEILIGNVTTAKLVALITDGALTVKLATAGTAIPVGDTGKIGWFVLVGAGATKLLVSNSSGAARKLRYMIAGS